MHRQLTPARFACAHALTLTSGQVGRDEKDPDMYFLDLRLKIYIASFVNTQVVFMESFFSVNREVDCTGQQTLQMQTLHMQILY